MTLVAGQQLEDGLVLVRVERQPLPSTQPAKASYTVSASAPTRGTRCRVDRSARRAELAAVTRGPGVRGGEDLAQVVDGDQRVDLRGGHRGVPEQLLDHADVGAAVEQVGGERVPQRVRRDVAGDAGPVGGLDQHRPGATAARAGRRGR